ncbi:metallophosphoesterase [Sinorhizobium kummerowiae]|uniref:Metallophosphoesterase n=1 Tax=Sinorhizobium kummerowiae TaxID=158892 RepID=A0ABY8TAD2_9HYPH|nr:metallophosphoesterase [Sinorhizobium kummerowiae]WHS94224.1 metallophosphoesterase [Sinorhizobium kummerowiae]WRW46152.1 metallophosphoesterase [Sinorhizobium kummerowiae]
MKAWIVSDMHVNNSELTRHDLEFPDADICICAGDVSGIVEMSMEFLLRNISPRMPVVVVLGNHEFYGATIDAGVKIARRMTKGTYVAVLENETLILGRTRIVGATLWTDFEIEHGVENELPLLERKAYAINVCKRYMMDFLAIFGSDWPQRGPGFLTAKELIERHMESRTFIARELADQFDGRTVVLSHHAPLPRSLHPGFKGHPSNGAFASDLSALIAQGNPDLWVHGHVHHFLDYREGTTRVICNPRGYERERPHTGFISGLVVDI